MVSFHGRKSTRPPPCDLAPVLSDVKGCAGAGSAPKAKFVFRYGGCLANPKKGNWTLCNALDAFDRNVGHNCDLKEPG